MSLNPVELVLDDMMNTALGHKGQGQLVKIVSYVITEPILSADFGYTDPQLGFIDFNKLLEAKEVRCELRWASNSSTCSRWFQLRINNMLAEFQISEEVLYGGWNSIPGHLKLSAVKRDIYKGLINTSSEYLTEELLNIDKKPGPKTHSYEPTHHTVNSPPSNEPDVVKELIKVCPGLKNILNERCPDDNCYNRPIGFNSRLTDWVIHLNDRHGWARSPSEAKEGQRNIADWLDEVALLKGWDLSLKLSEERVPSLDQRQIDFAEKVKKKKESFAQKYGVPKPFYLDHEIKILAALETSKQYVEEEIYPNNKEKYEAALKNHKKLMGGEIPPPDNWTKKQIENIKNIYMKGFEL